MYNNLAWTSNLLSIFMKITFHYKLSNSAQRKIFSRFLIIFGQFGKKKKNRSSFELKNKPLRLILDYDWCNANQDELCISLDSHQFLFYIEPILKTSSRISTETRSSKYTSSYFWCSSLQRTISHCNRWMGTDLLRIYSPHYIFRHVV